MGSEHFFGQRHNRIAAARHRLDHGARERKILIGVETRGVDFGLEEGGVDSALAEPRSGAQRGRPSEERVGGLRSTGTRPLTVSGA